MTPKMNRRDMMGLTGAGIGGALLSSACMPAWSKRPAIPKPTPAQVRWQNCEIGAIFHLDMPVLAGDYTHNNATRKTFDPKLYNPTKLDTDQWVHAAKAGGAKYAVFTATHFNGFMQWQSDLYPYGVKYAPWRNGKGDIVSDFVESCRNADILPGIYLSTHRNAYMTVWGHYVNWSKGRGTEEQAAYNRIAEKQVEELCSRYGDLVQIWFDAGVKTPKEGGPDVLPIFNKHQPDSVFYHNADRSDHRWIGNEHANVPYPCWATMPGKDKGGLSHNSPSWKKVLGSGDPDGSVWSPGMADIVLRGRGAHDWFWRPQGQDKQYTVDQLMKMYDASVGRNTNFLIGLVVNPEGLVPEPDCRRMEDFGRALRKGFSRCAGKTSGRGNSVVLELDAAGEVDTVVIREDIAEGERVRRYNLEGRSAAGWQKLGDGQSIGNKRIQRIGPEAVDAIRLSVTEARAEPLIRELSCYKTDS